jgi:hypothetical protein
MKPRTIIGGVLALLALLAIVYVVSLPAELPEARTATGYGWINVDEFSVTATGVTGSATGSGQSDTAIRGHVYAVYLEYADGITTTTDVTLAGTNAPAATLFTRSNSATDGWFYPAVQQTNSSAAGAGTYDRAPVADWLTASLAQSQATTTTTTLTVTVYWGQ